MICGRCPASTVIPIPAVSAPAHAESRVFSKEWHDLHPTTFRTPTGILTSSPPVYHKARFGNAAHPRPIPAVAREFSRFLMKHPLSTALADMTIYLAPVVDGQVAPSKAPITEDPEVLTRHAKRLGYFLKADIVGICRVP